jgi:hypothetical protein
MDTISADQPQDGRLRFLFDDTVVSVGLAPNATFGDIALALDHVKQTHHGHPVAIDVKLAVSPGGGLMQRSPQHAH